MSIDLRIGVIGKTKQDILEFVKKQKLGIRADKKDWSDFYVAGFGYKIYESPEYNTEEIAEAKEKGWYKPYMDVDCVRLTNTTNMGWSFYGETRDMQFPIAHMLAQLFALYLNCTTFVDDPQSEGKLVYYRRKDHPEIHDLFDNKIEGFRGDEYDNFCETRKEDGEWEDMGWRAKLKRKQSG